MLAASAAAAVAFSSSAIAGAVALACAARSPGPSLRGAPAPLASAPPLQLQAPAPVLLLPPAGRGGPGAVRGPLQRWQRRPLGRSRGLVALRAAAADREAGLSVLTSVPGQKVAYLMSENPMLVEDAIDREWEALEAQRLLDVQSNRSAAADELRERMAEVRSTERRRTAAELLYLTLCKKFQDMGAPLVPSLRAGGYVKVGKEVPYKTLTTDIHTPEAMQMLRDVVAKTVISSTGMPFELDGNSPVQMPMVAAGQLYATTALFGHFLRRADAKFRLERSMGMLAAGANGKSQSLEEYVQSYAPEQLTSMGLISSVEAQEALELHVTGIFGDLLRLRDDFIAAAGVGDILESRADLEGRLQKAIDSGKVPVLRFGVGDLRRMLLEAVAFGAFLGDLGNQIEGVYELTPSTSRGLGNLGVDNGGPSSMPWMSR